MKGRLKGIFSTLPMIFTAIGVFVFLLVLAAQARETLPRGAGGGLRTPSSQAPSKAQVGQAPSQKSLAGTWKFNRGQSDNPMLKVAGDDVPMGDSGIPAPSVGTVPQDTGGLSGMGGGLGGGGTPPMAPAPPAHSWETEKDREKKLEYLMPDGSLTIEEKESEFDLVDDKSRKQILYTDGRKLRKSKDDKLQEFAAHLDSGRLVYAEKRPPHGMVTRTFELSSDGRQMYETTEIDNGSLAVPIDIKYVYDAAPPNAGQ